MSETTELDKSRRYLRPVAGYDSDAVHLSVYRWLPMFDAWATGMSLCGQSMRQGPLPEGSAVTCAQCQAYRPTYERMLTPGYKAEDDDPEVLRRRAETAEREVTAARKFAVEMRDFCSPHGVATDYADRLIEAMDRARAAGLPTGAREVRIHVQAPSDENAGQWAETIRDLVLAEYGDSMRLEVTITPEGRS